MSFNQADWRRKQRAAAKAALESYCRQLSLELGPRGIAVNAIRAGVTKTPALDKIPGAEEMMRVQRLRNPGGRLTTPEDVAEAIALLARPGAAWISGNAARTSRTGAPRRPSRSTPAASTSSAAP